MPVDPAKPFNLTFPVTPTYAAYRLDAFVKAMVPKMSRTKIQKYIARNRVEVNHTPRRSNWIVRDGDFVVLICDLPEGGDDAGRFIPLDIVHEDDDILVVNKQPGLVVHPVALHRHDTLLNALYWRYKDTLPPSQEISLANRLDQFTSGIVLVTKHTASKQALQPQFEGRTTKKEYLALCHGLVEPDAGEIDAPIGPAEGTENRTLMAIRRDEAGKPSHTHFEVVERFPPTRPGEPAFTLVRLAPVTGRQHQLRVHMQFLGHPLVCDDRYGTPDALLLTPPMETHDGHPADTPADSSSASLHKADACEPASINPNAHAPDSLDVYKAKPFCMLDRYALHAYSLTFTHPTRHTRQTCTAPLAPDMQAALDALRAGWHRTLVPPQSTS